jgi:hypothetical protein
MLTFGQQNNIHFGVVAGAELPLEVQEVIIALDQQHLALPLICCHCGPGQGADSRPELDLPAHSSLMMDPTWLYTSWWLQSALQAPGLEPASAASVADSCCSACTPQL